MTIPILTPAEIRASVAAKIYWRTPPEIAEELRVKAATVRGWCKGGELKSANLAAAGCSRPRYKIHPIDLQIFLDRRSAGPAPKVARKRRKNEGITEYF